jgi:hypothetical protein
MSMNLSNIHASVNLSNMQASVNLSNMQASVNLSNMHASVNLLNIHASVNLLNIHVVITEISSELDKDNISWDNVDKLIEIITSDNIEAIVLGVERYHYYCFRNHIDYESPDYDRYDKAVVIFIRDFQKIILNLLLFFLLLV